MSATKDGDEAKAGTALRVLDAVSKLAGIATPLVLGWLTFQLSADDQQKRSEQATADTVLKVIEMSAGKDDATKNVGLTIISAIEQDGMGGLLDTKIVYKDGFKSLLSKLQDTISAESASAPSTDVSAPLPSVSWVYLGTWDETKKTWRTRYLDFGRTDLPDSFKGRQIKVPTNLDAVYLRSGPSTPSGLEPVVGVLRRGQSMTVVDVQQGSQSGHYWANVKPGT